MVITKLWIILVRLSMVPLLQNPHRQELVY
jgi:hypothetical protein